MQLGDRPTIGHSCAGRPVTPSGHRPVLPGFSDTAADGTVVGVRNDPLAVTCRRRLRATDAVASSG